MQIPGDASGPLEVWFVSWLQVGQPLVQVEVMSGMADGKNSKMHRFVVCLEDLVIFEVLRMHFRCTFLVPFLDGPLSTPHAH